MSAAKIPPFVFWTQIDRPHRWPHPEFASAESEGLGAKLIYIDPHEGLTPGVYRANRQLYKNLMSIYTTD